MAARDIVVRLGAEYRPCWVRDRRAIFHRWADSARPVSPRGQEKKDTENRLQISNVHGLVEYEDGTMERVWPQHIQFADGGCFEEFDWDAMERERDGRDTPLPFDFGVDEYGDE